MPPLLLEGDALASARPLLLWAGCLLFSILLTFHGFGARLNWSGRSGSAHSADLCFIGYVFFWVDRGGLRPAARAALARFLQ